VLDTVDVVWGTEEEVDVVVELVVVVVVELVVVDSTRPFHKDKLLIVRCPGWQQESVEYCRNVNMSPS
jgi:hypothetical protein